MKEVIRGKAYVLGDNIDTDAIIPAHFLHLSHANPAQKDELGSHTFEGLPDGFPPFIKRGETKTEYKVVVAGENFGCGSSRAQAPGCMNACGVEAAVAQSYARIFFRNSVNAGLLMPIESAGRLCDVIETGDEVEVYVKECKLIRLKTGKEYPLRGLGAVAPILEAGDVFAYAKQIMTSGASRK